VRIAIHSFWAVAIVCCLVVAAYSRAKTKIRSLPVIGAVPEFDFTDSDGRQFGLTELSGQIWIVDFIFTRCAGTCPVLSTHMASLQKAIPPHADVRLVSITVDPANDSSKVLRDYAEKYGADPSRWTFLRAPKRDVYRLARDGFRLTAQDNPEADESKGEERFIHAQSFVMVDRGGRIRGYYNGIYEDDVQKLLVDLDLLLRE
jgi:protein SCO1/2